MAIRSIIVIVLPVFLLVVRVGAQIIPTAGVANKGLRVPAGLSLWHHTPASNGNITSATATTTTRSTFKQLLSQPSHKNRVRRRRLLDSYIVHLRFDEAPPVMLYRGTIPGYPATAPPAGNRQDAYTASSGSADGSGSASTTSNNGATTLVVDDSTSTSSTSATADKTDGASQDASGREGGGSGAAGSRVPSSRRLRARKGNRRDGFLSSGGGRFGSSGKGSGGVGGRSRGRAIPRVDVNAAHVKSYASYLVALHHAVAAKAGVLKRRVFYSYTKTLNAFAARLTPSQVRLLQYHPSVSFIQKDHIVRTHTTYSPRFLRVAKSVWPAVGGQRNAGKGVIIGVIDSGIWPEHPAFSNSSVSGTPPSHWKGKCFTSADFPATSCNGKIIGARFYLIGFLKRFGSFGAQDFLSPRDGVGHGTWCASAAAGTPNTPVFKGMRAYGLASGVAPAAHIASYKALWLVNGQGVGVLSDITAAIDDAVADGCDVLSMSFGTRYTSYFDDIALLNAAKVGVFAAVAAGNSGNPQQPMGFGTALTSAAPFYLTVGASTMDRIYTPIRKIPLCIAPAPLVTSFSSQGPVLDPKEAVKSFNLTNDILKPDVLGPGKNVWGAWRARAPGEGVFQQSALMSGTSMATAHLAGVAAILMQAHSTWTVAQVKSAIMTTTRTATNYLTPIALETAYTVPATPWQRGSGEVDGTHLLDPGLVFDTSYDDYVTFLAGQDGVRAEALFGTTKAIKGYELNQPNIMVSLVNGSISVQRTFMNVGTAVATYYATNNPPPGTTLVVDPIALTIAPGQYANFTVNITLQKTVLSRQFTFGNVTWMDGFNHYVYCVIGVQAI